MTSRFRLPACATAVAALLLSALPLGAAAAPLAAGEEMPPNLALTATASASSVELDDARFLAEHINDDDSSTRWSSGYDDDNWVQLELAEPAQVSTIELEWPNACARDFSIQTSVDGEVWTTNVERTAQNTCPRIDTIELDVEQDISFIRMQGADRWSTYGYSISEFRVYDQKLPEPVTPLPLVPEPVSVERGEGTFAFGADVAIAANEDAADAAAYLAEIMRPSTGFDVPVVDAASDAQIALTVAPGGAPAGHADEGYTLDVTDAGIAIAADTGLGALNAVQTLRQLMPQWIESAEAVSTAWTVPIVSISDYPRFEHRGLMVDTARSFYTVDEIKRLIDSAAPLKLNRLHLHLTDDQGWRIAIDTPDDNASGIDYGDLTKISGKTAMTYNHEGDVMGTELGHTGFYTKDDYRAIIDYAAQNGMTVVPEVDLPGHTNAALHAIPELNSDGSSPQPAPGDDTAPHQGTGDVGNSSLDANNDATYQFIAEVLRQIAEMTPGEYLHIGGDEAHNTSRSDYEKMVDFATATVADLGKTVVGWNEYASTNLPQDSSVVQLWNGSGRAVADAVENRGAQVIMSPANKTYMPQKQDSRQPQGGTWACGGPCTLENAHNWDPAKQIAGVDEDSILGVEAAFWGEFIRGVDQAQFYTFPRVLATAEAGWSSQESKDRRSFIDRTGQLGGRMTLQGINFFPTASVDWQVSAASSATADSPSTLALRTAAEPQETARVNWRVTAPNTTAAELTAEVVWDDGERQPVELAASRGTSIEGMTINSTFTGSTAREFDEAGTFAAELQVSRDGELVATSTASVVVGDVPDPGEPGDGSGGDGDNQSPGDGDTDDGADDGVSGSDSGSADSSDASSTGADGQLPYTGADASLGLIAALALLGAGGIIMLVRREVARRRRRG